MDIFSHGLWAGAAYKAVNKKAKKPLNVWLAGFWGVFPDLFAFTIGFAWIFGSLIFEKLSKSSHALKFGFTARQYYNWCKALTLGAKLATRAHTWQESGVFIWEPARSGISSIFLLKLLVPKGSSMSLGIKR